MQVVWLMKHIEETYGDAAASQLWRTASSSLFIKIERARSRLELGNRQCVRFLGFTRNVSIDASFSVRTTR